MAKQNQPKTEPPVEWWVKNARGYSKSRPYKHRDLGFPRPKGKSDANQTTDPGTAGVPVDANLAVHLIANFLKQYKLYSDKVSNHFTDKESQKVVKTIENAFDVSYGISFSREIILKILSQPKCEGIRLYFCAREDKPMSHVSLVVVGTDAQDYDLNYNPDTVMALADLTPDDDPPTNSIIGEYGYPPDDGLAKKLTDPKYYLLQEAKKIAEANGGPLFPL